MTMDDTIKESQNGDKWKSLFKGEKKLNGNSCLTPLANANGNHDSEKEKPLNGDVVEYTDEEISCGIGSCTPKCLQPFASKQAFVVIFCLTWVIQGMFATYFVSVITTIEKLFQLQSKVTGMILSATEVGQICCSLMFTYYGGHGHRPRWIAWGMVLFAMCAFFCSLPHFFFEYPNALSEKNMDWTLHERCHVGVNLTADAVMKCDKQLSMNQQATGTNNIVFYIFLVALLGVGMGQTPVYTLGISYIDDNVAGRESALYFAITIGVRIIGPALGFILGSICTRFYIDLSPHPPVLPTDPQWRGAWWLGLVIVSGCLLVASLGMFLFPKRLKGSRSPPALKPKIAASRKSPKLRDFPKTIKRLLKNDILMFRTASSVLHILPIAGLYTFLPKFLESQFRFPAYTANMVAGVGGILVMGLGIIISGVFILKKKPNAKFVAGWIACAAALYAIGMGILSFVGCPMPDLAELKYNYSNFDNVSVISECAESCKCDRKFNPVCGSDKLTHFSACHAGCQTVTDINGSITYSNCTCLFNGNSTVSATTLTATPGYCDLTCNNFFWYIALFSFFVFIHSTSEVGSMLLTLRCVDPVDKAMALGIIQFAIGVFGNVPCSIIYGAVVDSACLIWDTVCGGKLGACSLYDSTSFRHLFHGTTGALMCCAFIVDLIVWYKADKINVNDEPIPATHEEELTPITEKSCFETTKN